MAKAQYIGVNNVARKVTKQYVGVDNVARQITKGYIGVNNVAREYFTAGTPVSELEIGSSVYMNINGIPTEFIVVHQGNPDEALYDSSCDGTWLLMKDIYESKRWHRMDINRYDLSEIHGYLNGNFINLFDSDILSLIKQVKIPYYGGGDLKTSYKKGSEGLSTQIFLLSAKEIGYEYTANGSYDYLATKCGTKLSYFDATNLANSKRQAYDESGKATSWWLRSASADTSTSYVSVSLITADGKITSALSSGLYGVRPAFILPSEVLVDDKFNVIIE